MTMAAAKMGTGISRGGRRAAIHLLKAGVEVLKGLEALFDELSAAARGEERDAGEEERGPERIRLD